jgi:uncharacterized protein involved in cysteine biosynthesis
MTIPTTHEREAEAARQQTSSLIPSWAGILRIATYAVVVAVGLLIGTIAGLIAGVWFNLIELAC